MGRQVDCCLFGETVSRKNNYQAEFTKNDLVVGLRRLLSVCKRISHGCYRITESWAVIKDRPWLETYAYIA